MSDLETRPVTSEPARSSVIDVHRYDLVVGDGPDKGRTFTVDGARAVVGSGESADVRLRDRTVSRHHCELAAQGADLLVRDLSSRNGTRIDGVRIERAVLAPRQALVVGETRLHARSVELVLEAAPSRGIRTELGALTGASSAMQRLFEMIERVAPTTLTCVILGETGTGKELVARALADASLRRGGPFVVVDCGALSTDLTDSDLFGHERGAFTGADKRRTGAFERANGGTLFLDEIGELPLPIQPKLLRALERREVQRLGGDAWIEVDVRVIAATHRPLPRLVDEGSFREDLYHRLAEVVLVVPPLRERAGDVALIAERLLAETRANGARMTADAVEWLKSRAWPGNVRELRNLVRRASALAEGPELDRAALTAAVSMDLDAGARLGDASVEVALGDGLRLADAREAWLARLEAAYVERLLERFPADLDAAAESAGVHRKSLQRLARERLKRSVR